MNGEKTRGSPSLHELLATGLSLGLLLMIVRAYVLSFRYLSSILGRAAGFALAAYYDLLYVAGVTAIFLAGFSMTRSPKARRALHRLLLGVAAFSLLAALANVKLVPMLGRPLNYQWLYYSDFLRSQEARNAIFAELSWSPILIAAGGMVGLLVLSRAFRGGLSLLLRRFGQRRLTHAAATALSIYFLLGGIVLSRHHWPPARLENPIVSFARSMVIAGRSPGLLTMKTSVGSEDFEPPRPSSLSDPASARPAGGIRNVVMVVLESVPAQYLESFGGPYPVMPELARQRGHAAIFSNIYAHCPETSHSLVSLLTSIYPQISYESLTMEQPGAALPSLSSELKRHGYRTAFFNAADLRYQHSDLFLSHREFDEIEDYRTLPCDAPTLWASTKGWPFLDGKDDACAADAAIGWIDRVPDQPFLAVIWTMMTHFPYFPTGREEDFGVAKDFGRYLNALRHDDSVVGNLLRALDQRRLDRSTLVVVVGDHGEAFGQHDQWVHASQLYEENVHVPLVLMNPELFHGEQLPVVGGLIDVAPTVLETLGFTAPPGWQGRSLWTTRRSGRVYFFASRSDHLFGLREGDTKVIYDAEDGHFEIYDLSTDPRETVNLARKRRAAIPLWEQRLATWVQYQAGMMRRLAAEKAR